MASLNFCKSCGMKQVKDVKEELEQLFAKNRSYDSAQCGICNAALPHQNSNTAPPSQNVVATESSENGQDGVMYDEPDQVLTVCTDVQEGQVEQDEEEDSIPCVERLPDDNERRTISVITSDIKKHYVDPGMVLKGLDSRVLEMIESSKDLSKPFKCKICHIGCAKIFNFLKHLHIKHQMNYLQEKPYSCEYCGEQFTCFTKVQKHLETHAEEGSKFFHCKLCNSTLKTIYGYRRHVRLIHNEERNFPCGYCGKKFRDKAELTGHEAIHTDKRPHKCDQCPRAFRLPNRLRAHQRIHQGIKPFTCEYCGHKLRDKNALSGHVKKFHTGVKKLCCRDCDFKTNWKKELWSHVKTVHGKEVTKELKEQYILESSCNSQDANMQQDAPVIFQFVSETDSSTDPNAVKTEEEISVPNQTVVTSDFANRSSVSDLPPETVLAISKLLQHADDDVEDSNEKRNDEVIYQCMGCGFQCPDSGSMRDHMSAHCGGEDGVAQIKAEDDDENGLPGNSNETILYKCAECEYTSAEFADLNSHILDSHQDKNQTHVSEDIAASTSSHHNEPHEQSVDKTLGSESSQNDKKHVHVQDQSFDQCESDRQQNQEQVPLSDHTHKTSQNTNEDNAYHHAYQATDGVSKKRPSLQCNQCNYRSSDHNDLRIHQASHISVKTSGFPVKISKVLSKPKMDSTMSIAEQFVSKPSTVLQIQSGPNKESKISSSHQLAMTMISIADSPAQTLLSLTRPNSAKESHLTLKPSESRKQPASYSAMQQQATTRTLSPATDIGRNVEDTLLVIDEQPQHNDHQKDTAVKSTSEIQRQEVKQRRSPRSAGVIRRRNIQTRSKVTEINLKKMTYM